MVRRCWIFILYEYYVTYAYCTVSSTCLVSGYMTNDTLRVRRRLRPQLLLVPHGYCRPRNYATYSVLVVYCTFHAFLRSIYESALVQYYQNVY